MKISDNIHKLESGEFDEQEKKVFDLVLKACNKFSPPVIARVAGGWVRDRILGKASNDIDLAIEGAKCTNFGELLLKEAGIENEKNKMVVIAANPEMSKYMETVRVCLFPKFWIDICNLRPADLNANEGGTAKTDADRRDITINALFFNINTRKVEDLVGGISDIENKLIRTPVDPILTFSEDPLRLVRVIRFAAKYGFHIDQSIFDSIPQVKEKFQNNVTRERITAELLKMFETTTTAKIATDLIFKSTLFTPIFNPENLFQINEETSFQRIQIALSRCNSNEKVFDIFLSAAYYDLPSLGKMADPLKPTKKIDPIEYVVVRQIKIPVKNADFISALIKSEKTVETLKNNLNRLSVGHWIRQIKKEWPLTKCLIFDDNTLQFFDNVLVKFVNDEKMEELIDMKPLFNGRQLADLHNISPGPQLKQYVEQLADWQIMNPNGKPEEYKAHIKVK